jgi:hypothetical protein
MPKSSPLFAFVLDRDLAGVVKHTPSRFESNPRLGAVLRRRATLCNLLIAYADKSFTAYGFEVQRLFHDTSFASLTGDLFPLVNKRPIIRTTPNTLVPRDTAGGAHRKNSASASAIVAMSLARRSAGVEGRD